MTSAQARLIYEFGGFRLDAGQRRLYAGADGEPIAITARVFDTLLYLVEHCGELLDKRALMNAVWPDVIVEENSLNQNISALRKALGEAPGEHRFIVTVPGRGYRFVAEVKTLPGTGVTPAAVAASNHATRISTASSVPSASIAVVPFANLTGDPSKEYLSDGLAEELIHALCRVPDLKVPSRISSFAYKGRKVDVRRIASDLGVEAVLEGSVRSAGERLRVTAQLVDAHTGYHRWSQSYDRKFEDLFALQDDLAQAIMQAVRPSLHGGSLPTPACVPPTQDLEAYQLYLQGQSLCSRVSEQNLLRAIELFEEASKRDPHFTRAVVAAHFARVSLSGWGYRAYVTTAAAEREARQALALDPGLYEAHSFLGHINAKRGKWLEAQKHYLIAMSVDVHPALRTFYASVILSPVGHMRLSLQEHNEAFRAAPTDPRVAGLLAIQHMILANDAEALRYARLAGDLGLATAQLPAVRSNVSLRAKRYEEAAEQMFSVVPDAVRSQIDVATLKLAYRGLEDTSHRPAALAALERLDVTAGDAELDLLLQIHVMLLYTLLGTTERAFDCAERFLGRFAEAGEIGAPGVWATLWFPEMRPFREHSRFVGLAERLGLMDYWQVHGPPDGCKLSGRKLIWG